MKMFAVLHSFLMYGYGVKGKMAPMKETPGVRGERHDKAKKRQLANVNSARCAALPIR